MNIGLYEIEFWVLGGFVASPWAARAAGASIHAKAVRHPSYPALVKLNGRPGAHSDGAARPMRAF
jgi:hypothetical protein